MPSKILSKRIFLAVLLAGFMFSAALLFYLIPKTSSQTSGTPLIANAVVLPPGQASSGLSLRLKIPKINVDAAVENVSLTPEGAMDTPKGPDDVAWFDLGPRPGDSGSAVIAGHEGWKNGIPAVFDDLHTLQKGDKVYVEDGKGAIVAFVVREVRTYGENGNPADVFSSSDGKVHLNLITCEGVWDKTKKSYSNRLVVFTDKEYE